MRITAHPECVRLAKQLVQSFGGRQYGDIEPNAETQRNLQQLGMEAAQALEFVRLKTGEQAAAKARALALDECLAAAGRLAQNLSVTGQRQAAEGARFALRELEAVPRAIAAPAPSR